MHLEPHFSQTPFLVPQMLAKMHICWVGPIMHADSSQCIHSWLGKTQLVEVFAYAWDWIPDCSRLRKERGICREKWAIGIQLDNLLGRMRITASPHASQLPRLAPIFWFLHSSIPLKRSLEFTEGGLHRLTHNDKMARRQLRVIIKRKGAWNVFWIFRALSRKGYKSRHISKSTTNYYGLWAR